MRNALFILALAASIVFIQNTANLFAKETAQKYKYEYLFDTDLPTEKFKDAFYGRLTEKYNWNQMGETNLQDDTFNSKWSFTDENQQKWECAVTIKRVDEKVAVTLEMEQVLGS